MVSLPQLVCKGVVGILGPGHPRFIDGKSSKVRSPLPPDAVQMVLVLVRDDDEVEMTSGSLGDVLDDVADGLFVDEILGPGLHPTVNEHVDGLTPVLVWQCQEEAVTMTLTVHPDRNTIFWRLKPRHD
jgi:hypothetical protein